MEGHVEPHAGKGVGAILRERRRRQGRDLAELAYDLHIRRRYLEAIEDSQYQALPAPVYAIGFVRSYAELLGLDGDEIVRRFKIEIAGLGVETPLHFPLPISQGSTPKGGVVLLGAIIAVAGYISWYAGADRRVDVSELIVPVPERLAPLSETSGHEAPAPTAIARQDARSGDAPAGVPPVSGETNGFDAAARKQPPRVADRQDLASALPMAPTAALNDAQVADEAARSSISSPLAISQTTGSAQAAELPDEVTAAGRSDARIELHARADSWVEVREPRTDALVAARLLKAGEIYRIPDKPGLKLVTGNAGGLVVVVDGKVAPSLGKDGAVRRGIPLDADALRKGID